MTFDEYQAIAKTTAVYPQSEAIKYPTLGLCSEAGEVAGQVKRISRDDGGNLTPDRAAKLAGEIGDVLYYIAALCSDLGISMDLVARQNLAKLAES